MSGRTPRSSRALLTLLFVATLPTLHCGGIRPSMYYAIPPPNTEAQREEPLSISLSVEPPSAPSIYRDTHIVYGYGPTQMGIYEYHRWIDPPPVMLQSAWVRLLRSSGRYAAVESSTGRSTADYTLRGRLYEFLELDPDGDGPLGVVAKVSFDVSLVSSDTGEIVQSCSYDEDESVQGTDVSAVVEAMTRNTYRGLETCHARFIAYFVR